VKKITGIEGVYFVRDKATGTIAILQNDLQTITLILANNTVISSDMSLGEIVKIEFLPQKHSKQEIRLVVATQ
jgi:hypothetical protein